MVTKERLTENPEDLKHGLDIVQNIINRVNNVIAEEIPHLAKNGNLINPNKLVISSADELVASADLITPSSSIGFYRSLKASGVPEAVVDAHRKDSIEIYCSDPTDQSSILI